MSMHEMSVDLYMGKVRYSDVPMSHLRNPIALSKFIGIWTELLNIPSSSSSCREYVIADDDGGYQRISSVLTVLCT